MRRHWPGLRSDFSALFQTNQERAILTVLLLVVTFSWMIWWVLFNNREISLLVAFIPFEQNYFSKAKYAPYLFPILLSIGFGFMFGFGLNLEIYLIAVAATITIAFIGDLVLTKLLARSFLTQHPFTPPQKLEKKCQNQLIEIVPEVRTELCNYFFQSTYFIRFPLALFMLTISWMFLHKNLQITDFDSINIAYAFAILAILANEIPVFLMRRARDGRIYEIEKKFIDEWEIEPTDILFGMRADTSSDPKRQRRPRKK